MKHPRVPRSSENHFFIFSKLRLQSRQLDTETTLQESKEDMVRVCEGENQDKLLDCTRDGKLGQLSQLQHIDTSVEGLGNELHGNVVDDDDEWD